MSAFQPVAPNGEWQPEHPNLPFLAARLDDMALDLGKLRRLTIGTTYEYRVERICNEVWTLLAEFRLTAGERVRAGMDVEEALKVTDAEKNQMDWMLGLDREPTDRHSE